MTIAIETKYVGPSNTKPSRIIATTCNGQRLVVPFSYDGDSQAPYRLAAQALADKMNWPGKLIAGGTKAGYVFVFAD